MGNLCSIFHARFKQLKFITGSARKAQLMDYILLGWQTSKYSLRNSEAKWFMKPYSEIVEDTGIPKSTLERYIKELEDSGFIERRQALYSRRNEKGEYETKKGSYIKITEKLLILIKSVDKPTNNPVTNESAPEINPAASETNPTSCIDSSQNEGTEPLKMRGLNIRDLFSSSFNNVITRFQKPLDVNNPSYLRRQSQFDAITRFIKTEIKEEIPEPVKELILGTFCKLLFNDKKELSNPKQVVAEYLFALINVDYYMPWATDMNFRNNILAKKIRTNNWKTPKGFYNHFYLGQQFKERNALKEQRWEEEKEQERKDSKNASLLFDEVATLSAQQKEELDIIEQHIFAKGAQIEQLKQSIYCERSEESIVLIREHIERVKNELHLLYEQQRILEQGAYSLCA